MATSDLIVLALCVVAQAAGIAIATFAAPRLFPVKATVRGGFREEEPADRLLASAEALAFDFDLAVLTVTEAPLCTSSVVTSRRTATTLTRNTQDKGRIVSGTVLGRSLVYQVSERGGDHVVVRHASSVASNQRKKRVNEVLGVTG